MHRICNDVLYRRDDRPFDPSGRDHAPDEFADIEQNRQMPSSSSYAAASRFRTPVNLFTSDFKKIIFGSIAIGFLGCVFGLVLSYLLNVPSGAFIILVLVLFFLIVKAIKAVLKR